MVEFLKAYRFFALLQVADKLQPNSGFFSKHRLRQTVSFSDLFEHHWYCCHFMLFLKLCSTLMVEALNSQRYSVSSNRTASHLLAHFSALMGSIQGLRKTGRFYTRSGIICGCPWFYTRSDIVWGYTCFYTRSGIKRGPFLTPQKSTFDKAKLMTDLASINSGFICLIGEKQHKKRIDISCISIPVL